MWNAFTESARKGISDAMEKTGEALEKTGDAISKAASNPSSQRQNQRMMPRNLESMPAEEASASDIRARAAAALAKVQAKEDSGTLSSPVGNKKKKTSSVLLGASTSSTSSSMASSPGMKKLAPPPLFQNGFQNLQKGWSNVVEGAKKGVAAAQEAVEKEQSRLELMLQARDRPHYFSRELHLPLDVPALKDAEVVYVTDRIISMSHPALPSQTSQISGERKLAAVCHLLEKRHGSGNVMIWNLSEVTNYQDHANPVLERVGPVLAFSFPGSPAPPLGLWLQLLLSLEKWLQASPQNVAVVHCLTGKGRTSTVLAAFLCWMAEAGFEKTNMTMALAYIAQCKKMTVEELTIPSQRRYAQYFTNMLEGIRPSQPPLVLKRIIMSEAPHFALGPPIVRNKKKQEGDNNNNNDDGTEQVGENKDRMGCAPYLQVFQAGQLLHTVAATLNLQQQPDALPFCQVADGSISFHVEQIIQGDVLIRCRHLAHSTKQKISMFRAAFHTGYAPPNVLRFTKPQLDGACNDPRFPDDFFVDLILEPCNEKQVSEFYQQQQQEEEKRKQQQQEDQQEGEQQQQAENSRTTSKKDAVVTASTYDSMLHRDSRFWDVIAEHLKTTEEKEGNVSEEEQPKDSKASRMGPTVGKRRVFVSTPKAKTEDGKASDGQDSTKAANAQDPLLQTFSIGGELDFLPEPEKPKPKEELPPKKDSLMAALMGALEEEHHEDGPRPDTEEIVFEDDSTAGSSEPGSVPPPQPTIVALPPKEGSTSTDATKAPPAHQESTATTESMKEMENLLSNTSASDLDMDALLADDGDDDFNLEDYNVDDEDDELADLENFLNSK
ncbi:Putative tyrosine-protein phosphatase auxilin [Seminavis robusta]|uniref:Tyrosine-protein phosphatase auxilin n=1 Tax=Seminavis robusta TaxID=568900 RepID=A0A9N8HBN3_9STRA|nr:Putative tyrosine-protein phosphatase auxilin [Seminavis robusta]|eukprot:Sro370_g128480.1 Putative tyrosine-protein phosphatase auxilin (835) ;mRNA; f:41320-43945